jgi:RNase P subunit RPR2
MDPEYRGNWLILIIMAASVIPEKEKPKRNIKIVFRTNESKKIEVAKKINAKIEKNCITFLSPNLTTRKLFNNIPRLINMQNKLNIKELVLKEKFKLLK